MAQLGFFSRSVIASMRDWSGVPSHSPEMVEFRRGQDERRRWGLKRRHALKLCRLHGCSRLCGELGLHDSTERIPPLVWDEEVSWVRRPCRPVEQAMAASGSGGVPQAAPEGPVEADPVAQVTTRAEQAVRVELVAEAEQTVRVELVAEAEQAVRVELVAEAEQAVRVELVAEAEQAVRGELVAEAQQAARVELAIRAERAVLVEPAAETEQIVRLEPAAEAQQAVRYEPVIRAEQAVRGELVAEARQAARAEPAIRAEVGVRAEPTDEAEAAAWFGSTVRAEVVRVDAVTSNRPEGQAEVAARAESSGLGGFFRVARRCRSGRSRSDGSHGYNGSVQLWKHTSWKW
ncbi:hypothetical protein ACFY36_03690 [Actinoplanes sp. NPDC000266]